MGAAPGGALERVQGEALKGRAAYLSKNEYQVAKDMLSNKLKKEGADAALQAARNKEHYGIDSTRTTEAVTQNFHEGDPDRAAKIARAEKAIDSANKYLKGNLDRDGWDAARKQMKDVVANTAWLDDVNKGLRSDHDKDRFAQSLLNDKQVEAAVNKRVQELAGKRITEEDKQKRAAELKLKNPGMNDTDAHLMAAGQLEEEWSKSLENVLPDALQDVFKQRLDVADEMMIQEGDKITVQAGLKAEADVLKKFEDKYRNKHDYDQAGMIFGKDGAVKQDWDKFMAGGLEALDIFDKNNPDHMRILQDPELRKKFENQLGQSLLHKRLRTGSISKEEMWQIADAKWMGEDQNAAVARLQEIMETDNTLNDIIKKGQAEGKIDPDMWDKIKKLGSPALKLGVLAAILAMIAVPLSSAITIPAIVGSTLSTGAAVGIGGAVAGGLGTAALADLKG